MSNKSRLYFLPLVEVPPGLDPGTDWKSTLLPIGANATVTIPGPATGKVRIFSSLVQTSDNPAETLTTEALLQPAALKIWRAQSSTASSLALSNVALALVGGESIDVTNTTNKLGHLFFTYMDIEDIGYVPVRTTITGAAVATIIPAPTDPTKMRKWLNAFVSVGTATIVDRPSVHISNNDTAAHVIDAYLNGVQVSRGASLGAGAINGTTAFTGAGNGDLCVTSVTGDFGLKTETAISTDPVALAGLYQEFSI